MNERIKKLAEQAGFLNKDEESIEYFAELIIEECVEIADKSNQGSKSSNEGTEFYYNADIGDKIKQHFGINGMSTEDKKTLIKELLGVKND
jgi:hypothetical protein